MRIISDGNERIKVLEEGNISYVTDDFALLYDLMVICYSDNMTVSYGNSTFTVEKAGIYHVDPNSYGVYYAASIKKEGELKKLDSKFLQEPTADDALALLIETGYIEPIADDEGIITDDNNVIYTF